MLGQAGPRLQQPVEIHSAGQALDQILEAVHGGERVGRAPERLDQHGEHRLECSERRRGAQRADPARAPGLDPRPRRRRRRRSPTAASAASSARRILGQPRLLLVDQGVVERGGPRSHADEADRATRRRPRARAGARPCRAPRDRRAGCGSGGRRPSAGDARSCGTAGRHPAGPPRPPRRSARRAPAPPAPRPCPAARSSGSRPPWMSWWIWAKNSTSRMPPRPRLRSKPGPKAWPCA